jgi:hypothetical protein
MAVGEVAMTSGLLFKKTDISGFDLYGDPGSFIPVETVIDFSPLTSGSYYFGFHDLSLFYQGLLSLSNISITEKTNSLKKASIALTGKSNNTDNILNWSIEDYSKSGDFEIERSSDGINFIKINDARIEVLNALKPRTSNVENLKSVNVNALSMKERTLDVLNAIGPIPELKQGQDGRNYLKMLSSAARSNTTYAGKISYTFTDTNAAGVNFYRTKQTVPNGNVKYSNIILLKSAEVGIGQLVHVYPNPVKDVLNVEIGKVNATKMKMVVSDSYGRIVINKEVEQFNSEGTHIQLSTSDLSSGIYILKLTGNNGFNTALVKFVKQR